jgi:hypothetical protein
VIIQFEFKGGCKDGEVVVGQDDLRLGADKNPAHLYLLLTDGGRVGATFREPLPPLARREKLKDFTAAVGDAVRTGKEFPKGKYPPDYQIYKVADRRIGPAGISIRLEYVCDEPAAPAGEHPEKSPFLTGMETLNDFRRMLLDPGGWWYPRGWLAELTGLVPRERPPLPVKVQRPLRIIDAMTAVERLYPSTLIDAVARERIARGAGATPEDVERLVRVFESRKDPGARAADDQGASDANRPERTLPEGFPQSDLLGLPVRACVAFAVRCALRINGATESLDEEPRSAVKDAIAIAAEYAGGKDYDSAKLREVEHVIGLAELLQQLEGAQITEQTAVAVARWSVAAAWVADLGLEPQRPEVNPYAACVAVLSAKWAIAANEQALAGIREDLHRLKLAVERGEITADTPVPQSFFPAMEAQPPNRAAPDQPDD